MSALLTYRSRDSFETRFGRNIPDPSRRQNINGQQRSPSRHVGGEHFAIHNDGHKNVGSPRPSRGNSTTSLVSAPAPPLNPPVLDPEFTSSEPSTPPLSSQGEKKPTPTYFSAQSYLRYQGSKFINRFDANCYIAITRKLDTHDVSRNREPLDAGDGADPLQHALGQIQQPTLILGIESDGLFTFAEQRALAAGIPNATLKEIVSSEGHDAFLLEFEQVNDHLIRFMNQVLPDIMNKEPDHEAEKSNSANGAASKSMVSEVDDITAW